MTETLDLIHKIERLVEAARLEQLEFADRWRDETLARLEARMTTLLHLLVALNTRIIERSSK
jgi:hypothetical protein